MGARHQLYFKDLQVILMCSKVWEFLAYTVFCLEVEGGWPGSWVLEGSSSLDDVATFSAVKGGNGGRWICSGRVWTAHSAHSQIQISLPGLGDWLEALLLKCLDMCFHAGESLLCVHPYTTDFPVVWGKTCICLNYLLSLITSLCVGGWRGVACRNGEVVWVFKIWELWGHFILMASLSSPSSGFCGLCFSSKWLEENWPILITLKSWLT